MTDFIQDGTDLPTGKVDARPLTGVASEHITAAEWETVMQALYDARSKFQISFGYVNVRSFGAVGDGVTDDWQAFTNAIANFNSGNHDGATIFVPPGVYRLSKPLNINRGIELRGAWGETVVASGKAGASVLLFDDGSHGIIVDRSTTSPDGSGAGDYAGLRHLVVLAAGKTVPNRHGITLRARAFVEFCNVSDFSGDGIHVVSASDMNSPRDFNTQWAQSTVYRPGDYVQHKSTGGGDPDNAKRYLCIVGGTSAAIGGGPSGTANVVESTGVTWKYVSGCLANGFIITANRCTNNKNNGFFCEGDNVNAALFTGNDATLNGDWGFLDNSFLGNTYIGNHTATNGMNAGRNATPASVANWATSTAYTVGQCVRANGLGYICITAGTSAGSGTGPSGTSSDITDGTAHWAYKSLIWRPSAAYAVGDYTVNNGGKTYRCSVAGTTGATAPTTTSTTTPEVDGTVSWRYVPTIPGPFGMNLDVWGVHDGNANSRCTFIGNYSEEDQAGNCLRSFGISVGGLQGAGRQSADSAGYIEPGSPGGDGSYLRMRGVRFDTKGESSPSEDTFVIVGDQSGGAGFFAFQQPNYTDTMRLKFAPAFYLNTNFYVCGFGGVPANHGWGWGGESAKIGNRAVPPAQLATSPQHGIFIGASKVLSAAAAPSTSAGTWGQGRFYDFFVGDVVLNSAAAAGGTIGWVCTVDGTAGTYTEGLTCSGTGTTLTLSGTSSILNVGNYITVNSVKTRITAINGTSVTISTTAGTFGAGAAIAYAAPTFAEFGRVSGGAGSSVASPGNATLNTQKGRSAIAAGASAVTITNSRVTSTSIVGAVLQTVDGTLTQLLTVVPGSGSFVITGNANATGNVNVGWWIEE